MTPPAGWYPDPRNSAMLAWWDGQRWHLQATKPTQTTEWVGWGIGIVLGLALCAVFPPAVVLVGIGLAMWWYYSNAKKKRLREAQE
jgi:hypothetical protein